MKLKNKRRRIVVRSLLKCVSSCRQACNRYRSKGWGSCAGYIECSTRVYSHSRRDGTVLIKRRTVNKKSGIDKLAIGVELGGERLGADHVRSPVGACWRSAERAARDREVRLVSLANDVGIPVCIQCDSLTGWSPIQGVALKG